MITLLSCLALAFTALAETWQRPPPEIIEVLGAPEIPTTRLSPDGDWLLITTPVRYPPIADRAAPMLKLAGVRVDPRTGGLHTPAYAVTPRLRNVRDGQEIPVALPDSLRILGADWSADGAHIAVGGLEGNRIGLWTVDLDGAARAVPDVTLAPILGDSFQWLPDQRHLLVKRVAGRATMPVAPLAPDGPQVRFSDGEAASSTYEARDLLTSTFDDALFTFFATSQLAVVDVGTGAVRDLGAPGVYAGVDPSPDGRYLRVDRLVPPWSHRVTAGRFAHTVEAWTVGDGTVLTLVSLPLAEEVPIDGVPVGPRDFRWDTSTDATLVWTEALDGGDPEVKAAARDRLLRLAAPFDGAPTEWMRAPHRVWGVAFLRRGGALVEMDEWERRWRHIWRVDARGARPWYDGSQKDRYHDPGEIIWDRQPDGRWVVAQDGDAVYFSGDGGTPTGDRPFLDRRSLTTAAAERLFRSGVDVHEAFVGFTDTSRRTFLVRRQSETLVPNLYEVTLGARRKATSGEAVRATTDRRVTTFVDPTPQIRGITKQIVTYKRADGVPLAFTLYLPDGYQPGTPLPTVLYAYPLEYSDPATAGQVAGSAHTFDRFGGASHLFFLLRGYAVLSNTTMPVIGDPTTAYDTFVPQLIADAQAAIDKAVALGVTDRARVGVMGHSHGALMTATLLAHSDLFRAGIARSGAYNHTIRPFGFQNERRTLWAAKDTYLGMSPVLFAPEINEPILIVHGANDENPGTIPFQSDRLFESIRGSGGTARLVMLPFEGHGYQARESVEQVLWEQITWFDRYVAGAR